MISALTNDNSTKYELAIDMEDWSANRRFARYRSFRLGNELDKFRMYHQNLYYGNAGDSLHSHNGLPFSTFDVDNDNRDGDFVERSCARLYKVIIKQEVTYNETTFRTFNNIPFNLSHIFLHLSFLENQFELAIHYIILGTLFLSKRRKLFNKPHFI